VTNPEVVIVGAGVIGLSAALYALEKGVERVTVLDRHHPAAGSSGWAVGIVTRQYVTPIEVAIRARSLERFAQLEAEDGLGIVRNGFLRLGRDPAALEQFATGVAIQHENGVADARLVTPEEVGEIVPDLDLTGVLGGMFGPSDGYVDPHQLCQVYLKRIQALGGRVHSSTRVVGHGRGARLRHRVVTDGEPVEADIVVNAAGPWAGELGDLLGHSMPIINERHQVCVGRFNRPLGYVMPSVMDYVVGSGAQGTYFRHEGSDQLIGGLHTNELLGQASENPESYRTSVDDTYVATVAEEWLRRLPGLGDMSLVRGWAGLYPMTPDAQAILGPYESDTTVLAAGGFGGLGIMLSPIAGKLIAEWIVDGQATSVAGADLFLPRRLALA